jgi:uncharacterized RDD family membrane protein YckC
MTAPGPVLVPETFGNTAPKIEVLQERLQREDSKSRNPIQGRLFPTQEPKRVIPFESISPEAAKIARSTQERNAKTRSRQRYNEHLGVDADMPEEAQRELAFAESERVERRVEQVVERLVYSHARIAAPAHRAMALAFDAAMVLLAVGVLVIVYAVAGLPLDTSKLGLGTYAGMAVAVGLFYKLLFIKLNRDTPGMGAVRLRMVHFEERPPTQRERMSRLLVSLVSLVSFGLGLLWCLVDEEHLTWHDTITKTYPSPMESN